jgi:lipoyl-dependent peroxiredoxin
MPIRNASAVWEGGGLQQGRGKFFGPSGFKGIYSAGSRFQEEKGASPEELLAAAHAACYSMALSVGLDKNGTPPERVETKAMCTIEKVNDAFKITTMKLVVRARVPKLDEGTFQQIARTAKENCPMSGAIKGNVDIQLVAALEA